MIVVGDQLGMIVQRRADHLGVVGPVGGQPPPAPGSSRETASSTNSESAAAACGAGPWARDRGRTSTARPPMRAAAGGSSRPPHRRRPVGRSRPRPRPGTPGSGRSPAGRPRRRARSPPGGPGPSAPGTRPGRARSRRSAAPSGRTPRPDPAGPSGCTDVEVSSRGTSRTDGRGAVPRPGAWRPHPGAAADERHHLPVHGRRRSVAVGARSVMTDANLAGPPPVGAVSRA